MGKEEITNLIQEIISRELFGVVIKDKTGNVIDPEDVIVREDEGKENVNV